MENIAADQYYKIKDINADQNGSMKNVDADHFVIIMKSRGWYRLMIMFKNNI